MRKNKSLDDKSRLKILEAYFNSTSGKRSIEKKYGVYYGSIRYWLRIFGLEDKETIIGMKRNQGNEVDGLAPLEAEATSLKLRIKQLESELKETRMARDAYDCMIDMAEAKYHIKVRKNSNVK